MMKKRTSTEGIMCVSFTLSTQVCKMNHRQKEQHSPNPLVTWSPEADEQRRWEAEKNAADCDGNDVAGKHRESQQLVAQNKSFTRMWLSLYLSLANWGEEMDKCCRMTTIGKWRLRERKTDEKKEKKKKEEKGWHGWRDDYSILTLLSSIHPFVHNWSSKVVVSFLSFPLSYDWSSQLLFDYLDPLLFSSSPMTIQTAAFKTGRTTTEVIAVKPTQNEIWTRIEEEDKWWKWEPNTSWSEFPAISIFHLISSPSSITIRLPFLPIICGREEGMQVEDEAFVLIKVGEDGKQ